VTDGSGDSFGQNLASAGDAIWDTLTGIPAPIRKSAIAVVGRLITTIGEIPTTLLESKVAEWKADAAERKAESEGRIRITAATSKAIAKNLKVDTAFIEAAVNKSTEKLVKERINVNKIAAIAVDELNTSSASANASAQTEVPPSTEPEVSPPSEDWLNIFEEHASRMSSEHMQKLFGKILAGEIRKPSAYSIKTLNIISQLDNRAAELFVLMCSLSISLVIPNIKHIDTRVVSLSGSAASNSLLSYGLNFDALTTLEEYGLIISDYNSYMDYQFAVAIDNNIIFPVLFQGRHWRFVPKTPISRRSEVRLSGVQFSNAGKQLLPIVDITPVDKYQEDLIKFFDGRGMKLERLSS
jgi:hypothetical protein